MEPFYLILIIALYFLLLLGISKLVERKSDESSFFTGNRSSPWYLVAFGMIGASLSGVTFVSIPGAVALKQFAYFQMVLGFTVGYIVIALVLLPLYYRLNLTSIYSYLDTRFGRKAQLVGTTFFMISRVIGASLRMYLVVITLQQFVFDALGVPFYITIAISLALIWVYTSKAGIKTIVYTDTLQTAFMIIAMALTIFFILDSFDFNYSFIRTEFDRLNLSQTFFTDDLKAGNTFWKQFVGGAVVAIAMTGLDQDMMQKNLTCPNLKDAQKNVYSFTIVLVFVNALFLLMGALLFLYAQTHLIELPLNETGKLKTDLIYPTLALEHFPPLLGIVFFIGLISAAYSSADSALAALTTSFCFDIKQWKGEKLKANKTKVHLAFTAVLYVVIFVFCLWNNRAAIETLFTLAGYTYGPLLGIFFFGILTKRLVIDKWIPYICLASPVLAYGVQLASTTWLDYTFGYELLLLNGFITFGLLSLFPKKE